MKERGRMRVEEKSKEGEEGARKGRKRGRWGEKN